jgi:hypothetical protein
MFTFGDRADRNSYHLWGAAIKSEEPTVHYDEIMAHENGVEEWTAKIVRPLFSYENVI